MKINVNVLARVSVCFFIRVARYLRLKPEATNILPLRGFYSFVPIFSRGTSVAEGVKKQSITTNNIRGNSQLSSQSKILPVVYANQELFLSIAEWFLWQ